MESVDSEEPQAWKVGENLIRLPLELRPLVFAAYQNGFDALNYRILNKYWYNNWGHFLPQFSFGASHDPIFINQRPLVKFPNADTIEVELTHIGKECSNMDEFIMHLLSQASLKRLRAASIENNMSDLIEALKKHGHKLESISVSAYRYPRDYAPGNELLQVVANYCPNLTRLDFSVHANDLRFLENLKNLRVLTLGKAVAADLQSLRASPLLRRLDVEYAQLDSIDSECLKPFTNLDYLLLGGGNVEQQRDEPYSKSWLKEFVMTCIDLCSQKLPKQIGINCVLSINVSDGQADDTDQRTLLGLAIECHNDECVSILLDAGAELRNKNYVSLALDHCAQVGMARLFVERGQAVLPFLGAIVKSGLSVLDSSADQLEEDMQARLFCVPRYDEEDDEGDINPELQKLREEAAQLARTVKDDVVEFLSDILSVYAPREAGKMSSQSVYAYLTQSQLLKALVDARSHERLWKAIEELPLLQSILPDVDTYAKYKLHMDDYEWRYL